MSQENVELVKRGVEGWNRRNIEGLLEQATPDVEWIPASPAAVERSIYRGHEEIRQAFEAIWGTWEEFRFEASEIRDLGDSVVWLGRVHARGIASQIELDHEFATHTLVREGKVIRVEGFLSWDEALEAAGLRE
jgi:ketosteroid isomerase-like protein